MEAMKTWTWTRRRFLQTAAAMPAAAVAQSVVPRARAESRTRINLKVDCGAKGDGVTNDTTALQKAADIIQRAGGGELFIPAGVYVVGRQTAKSSGDAPGAYFEASDLFKVQGLSSLRIVGEKATLRMASGLRYGGFDPKTGRPMDATGGRSNAARVGRMLEIADSTTVWIEGLELDGNCSSLILGGQWGDVDRQAAATGIWINGCDDVDIVDVHTHHHALDGITVLHLAGPPPRQMPHRLQRVVSEYNGRQALSWIGGWGLTCTECKFNHTGRALNGGKPLMSKPRAGLDIEPNARTPQKSREGSFVRCEFIDNAGAGVVATEGDGGYSTFTDCTIWGTTNYSLYITKPGLKFLRCRIHGTAMHASDGRPERDGAPNAALATVFEDCTFEDKAWTDGAVFRNNHLYTIGRGAEAATWRRCTFINHKVRAVHVAESENAEVFEGCTFIHANAALPDGAHQALFEGSRIRSCRFLAGPEVASGTREYFVVVKNVTVDAPAPGEPPTRVEGARLRWQRARTGLVGEVAPGKFE